MRVLRPDATERLARHLFVTSEPAAEWAAVRWDDAAGKQAPNKQYWRDKANAVIALITEEK